MKKIYFLIPIIIFLLGGFIFLNGGDSKLEVINDVEAIFDEERLYMDGGVLYLEEGKGYEEVDSFSDDIVNISWSKDGKYFSLDSEDTSYIYLRDGLIKLKEIETNGVGVFSPDSKKIVFGVKDINNDLAVYNLESKYIEQVLEGKEGEVYLPKSWIDTSIIYLEKNTNEERELILVEKDEDRLMDLVDSGEDYKEVIGLLGKVDRDKLTEKYGDNSIMEVLEYLKEEEISDKESMLAMIEMSDTFVGQEYYKYIEALGEMYLKDISNFVKALTSFEDRTDEIAYALHDLKLYERENSNLTEDLNSIVRSKDLSAKEKEVGMNLITTYAECGA